jgi:hypothetical protein
MVPLMEGPMKLRLAILLTALVATSAYAMRPLPDSMPYSENIEVRLPEIELTWLNPLYAALMPRPTQLSQKPIPPKEPLPADTAFKIGRGTWAAATFACKMRDCGT